ncbi:cation:proton antiporter [Leptolyngbya sp. 7M]|nr:cation:proton antiporter [Leptolyngbya sp. 7M]QYO62354.1 cation:proton antiporter [Leptolyngbya sp. 7M]
MAFFLSIPSLLSPLLPTSLLAQVAEAAEVTNAQLGPLVLAGGLLSLVIIYLASKLVGELCARVNLPPVLGELIGGVVVGVSALNLLVFPEGASHGTDAFVIKFLESTAGLAPEAVPKVAESIGEVISVLSEIGVIILLFEIGLESDLKELIRVGPQAAVVAVVGVVVPFVAGTAGLPVAVSIAWLLCLKPNPYCWKLPT